MMRNQTMMALAVSIGMLTGCGITQTQVSHTSPLMEDIEAFSICDNSTLGEAMEDQIRAEAGFKRFAENTYRPVGEQRLFGHTIRIVEISKESNKIYVSGEPLEFSYHFKYLLPDIVCEKDTCQAPLPNGENLLIYKAKSRKAKDTTVIECRKPLSVEAE